MKHIRGSEWRKTWQEGEGKRILKDQNLLPQNSQWTSHCKCDCIEYLDNPPGGISDMSVKNLTMTQHVCPQILAKCTREWKVHRADCAS
eukprot:c44462_g1_i1 orf=40-306(-)